MRIKVFAPVDELDGKPPPLDMVDAACRMRVRVWHDNEWYELAVGQQNKLELRHVEGKQLLIQPRSSNVVWLDVDGKK